MSADSGRVRFDEPLDEDGYRRLFEGWLKGKIRGAETSELPPMVVSHAPFDVIEMNVTADKGGHQTIYLRAYVYRFN